MANCTSHPNTQSAYFPQVRGLLDSNVQSITRINHRILEIHKKLGISIITLKFDPYKQIPYNIESPATVQTLDKYMFHILLMFYMVSAAWAET